MFKKRYRIVKKDDGKFYTQKRCMFMWFYYNRFYISTRPFDNQIDAQDAIDWWIIEDHKDAEKSRRKKIVEVLQVTVDR